MSLQYKDYYKVLEIGKSASQEEIQKSFRKLARKFHPDLNKSAGAEDRFKEINEAYEVLGDAEKRKKYDMFGGSSESFQQYANSAAFDEILKGNSFFKNFASSGNNGFSDFFQAFFGEAAPSFFSQGQGRSADGQTIESSINITSTEALKGANKEVTFEFIDTDRNGIQRRYPKKYRIKIPPGTAPGSIIRLAGQGAPAGIGGKAGDLLLRVNILAEEGLSIDGLDIVREVEILPWEAVLGTEMILSVPRGKVKLKIPVAARSGQRFKIKGYGLNSEGRQGDLIALLRIIVPEDISPKEKALYEQLKEQSAKKSNKN
jgi:curved DNA-binding protein